jgi:hypothetical protein
MMLRATFLGWQSWLLDDPTRGFGVLIDPLLTSEVGRGAPEVCQSVPCWPPRRFDLDAFPPVGAVLLTHEHEDHFNIPSLMQIDRAVPVLLSSRCSVAAQTILRELGFTVRLVQAGERLALGPLQLETFAPDFSDLTSSADEWDVLPFLARHRQGHGSFFTNVDVPLTAQMAAHIEPTALTYIGMALRLGSATPSPERHAHGHRAHGFGPLLAAPDLMKALTSGETVTPLAGLSALLAGGSLVSVTDRTSEVATLARDQWPAPPGFWCDGSDGPTPVSTVTSLTAAEEDELLTGLERLAQWMFGGALFRRLCSVSEQQAAGRRPTFTLTLLTSQGEGYHFEYHPQACELTPLDQVPGDRHLGTVVCWASDLLRLLRGEFEPRSMTRACWEKWAPAVRGVSFIKQVLWPYFHPLRHPEKCLNQYRRIASRHAGTPVRLHLAQRPAVPPDEFSAAGEASGIVAPAPR